MIQLFFKDDCYNREMAYSKLYILRQYYPDIFGKVIGIIGGSSSDTTKSILRFVDDSKTLVISSIASAISLNNKPNFCRTIPDDLQQAAVMISILAKMNWTCAIGLYSNTEYGVEGDKVLKRLTAENGINYESQTINNLNATKVFVENAKTDIVLIFSDLESMKAYFEYLKNSNSKIKKIYIMGDTWVWFYLSLLIII
jgi:ABC-type branched-subunit amino acid transport system substrate-binding protein